MFIWNGRGDNSTSLYDILLSCNSIEKLHIASAFFSKDGFEVLKKVIDQNNLCKNDIELFLGFSFSMSNPHELLQELEAVCEVRIVFERTFHPKVYYIQGTENKLIFGSANFTSGGMSRNIEFIQHTTHNDKDIAALNKFFAYCRTVSVPVNADIVEFYRSNNSSLEQLGGEQRKVNKKLSGFIKQGDPFSVDDYDLSDYYFNFEDYETFFTRNCTLNHSEIRERRRAVQSKMLAVHNAVYPHIRKLGIACHKREENITSLIIPCAYNHYKVAWNGVRYGKTPKEIEALNFAGEKDDLYQFQKHGCIQFCITGVSFEINLFLAVKNDAVDRHHVREHIRDLKPKIESEIGKLAGHCLRWVIYDDENAKEYSFYIDDRNANEFCDYFKEYDKDGCESLLLLSYKPDDERISSFERICDEVVKNVELLLPLYNTMVWRPKV